MQNTGIFGSVDTYYENSKTGGCILLPRTIDTQPITTFDFELVFQDRSTRMYDKPEQESVIIRRYAWRQEDSNLVIDGCYHVLVGEYNYGNELLKRLNRKVDELKTAKNIMNRDGKTVTTGSRITYNQKPPHNIGCFVINGKEYAFRHVRGPYYCDDKGYYSDDYREK